MTQQLAANTKTMNDQLSNNTHVMNEQLAQIRGDNQRQLDEIRATVDERLTRTLNDRLSVSFKQINENLEAVYKGLGDMQGLAAGVGDLKKTLSNVKTRGILGRSSSAPSSRRFSFPRSMRRMSPPSPAAPIASSSP